MQQLKIYRWFFVGAIVLHAMLALVLLVASHRSHAFGERRAQTGAIKIIQATRVDAKTVQARVDRINQVKRRAVKAKKAKQLQKQRAIKAAKLAAQRKQQAVRAAKLAAQKKAVAAKQKRLLAAKQKARALRTKAQVAALVKQQQALEKKLLDQQVANEQQAISRQAQALRLQGIVNQYKSKILRAIAQHWVLPGRVDPSLSCQLLIRLAPGGVVLQVTLIKSSGNAVLDRSARVAVFKASPLPVPKDDGEFSAFRELRLTVRPEQLITG